ncbi:hypothetical protein DRP04_14445, partial [Archaeoglobales archaeon]
MSEYYLELLTDLGVHTDIISSLQNKGITQLRPFQYEALNIGLQNKSLVVVAPTGSGKTLIGEIIAVNRIIKEQAKAIYLTPYKALAEEIAETFRSRYPISVGVATGDYRDQPIRSLGAYDLIVLTYEKTDHIFREKPQWLEFVKVAIVDEIHLLGDSKRGPLLDIVLTYLLDKNIQIIGLSATILNPEDISDWLGAYLIKSDFRPVKLLECIYIAPEAKLLVFDPRPQEKERYFVSYDATKMDLSSDKFVGPIDKFLVKDAQDNGSLEGIIDKT